MRFDVRNVSGRDLELYLRGREPTLDVVIRDAAGGEVWRSLGSGAVVAVLQLRPLAAGDTLTLHASWQPAASATGRHSIEAALLTELTALHFPAATVIIRP